MAKNLKWPIRLRQRTEIFFYVKQIVDVVTYVGLILVLPYLVDRFWPFQTFTQYYRTLILYSGYTIIGLFLLIVVIRVVWKFTFLRSVQLGYRDDYLVYTRGIFNVVEDQISLKRIRAVQVKRSFGQRVLKTGDLRIISIDRLVPVLELKGILNPLDYQQFLNSKITVRSSEMDMRGQDSFEGGDGDTDFDTSQVDFG